jgi:imidazolonepropionase-like amidohydrolase
VSKLLFTDAAVLDASTGTLAAGLDVLVAGSRIVEVGERLTADSDTWRIPVGGRVLMPGLIDAHVHVMCALNDHQAMAAMPPYLVAAYAKRELGAMLRRGFTTIRDAGGAEGGLAQAVELDLFHGPTIFPSGLALAQTGGQGDFRERPEDHQGCPTCRSTRTITRVVDGPDEVRSACREELQSGATQIKMMLSGGNSGSTPVETSQFSIAEIEAAVEVAETNGTYVMAHAYGPASIKRAVECGVRTIEHGNLIDGETAAFIAGRAFLVPTLTTYQAWLTHADELQKPAEIIDQVRYVLEQGLKSLRLCRDAGVKLGFGTDLEGLVQRHQVDEFALRAQVETPAEVLHSALTVNAELLGCSESLGRITPGAVADILVVEGNPLDDVSLFTDDGRNIKATVTRGRVQKNELVA